MAKTFLVGEGAVKLVPNAAGFHIKARKDLARDRLNVPVDLRPDITGFTKQAKSRLSSVHLSTKVNLKPDVTGFRQEAQARLDAGKKLNLKVKIEADINQASVAQAHKEMQAQLRAMGPLKVKIEVDIDQASLRRALDMLRARVEAARITANINSRAGRMEGQPGGGAGENGRRRSSGGGGGGIGRGARTAAITTGVVMAPIVTKAAVGGLTALVGAASQAAGALGLLPAAAVAAGAGLATIVIGAQGIGGAFSALSAASQEAGSSVTQSASQQAAAQRSIEQADRGLATAHRGVTRALEDLNNARKEAVRRLRDMNDELKMAPLNEREGALAIKEAYKRLQEAYASGDSLEIEGAQIDVEKSKLQYDQLRKQNDDLATDVAEANKKGIEGDSQVIAAKDGVQDAVNSLKDAQDALASAMESAAEAANQMSGGVDKLAQAMAKLSPNAQDFVKKVAALGPAWTETRKFIQDRLFDGLGNSVVALATRQLPVLRTGLAGIAEELNGGVKEALAVFSTESAAKDFATTLGNIRGMWSGIADSFAPFSRGFIDVTTVGSTFMPRLGAAVRDMANAFADSMARWRADGTMERFFETSLTMAKQLGRILGNVGAIIYQIFSAGADVGGGFLNTIETATRELREFLTSADGQEGLKTFFEGVKVAVQTLAPIIQIVASTLLTVLGPALTDFVIGLGPGLVAMFQGLSDGLSAIQPVMQTVGEAIGSIGFALGDVFRTIGPIIAQTLTALAPAVEPLANALASIIKAVAPVLPVLATFISGVIQAAAPAIQKVVEALTPLIQIIADMAMQFLPPYIDLLKQWFSLMGDQFAGIIDALVPVLMDLSDTFVQMLPTIMELGQVWVDLVSQAMPSFVELIKAIIPLLPTLVQMFTQFAQAVLPILADTLSWLLPIVTGFFVGFVDIVTWALNNVIVPALQFLLPKLTDVGGMFTWLWNDVIKPAWDGISNVIKWAWENVISPTFDALKNGLQKVADFFSSVVGGISTAWDQLKSIAATPINWVINHVINGGIGRAWTAVDNFLGNNLPDWVDVGQIAMASGGEVPMAKGAQRGKDSVRILGMPGEHMWDVMDVVGAGGQQAMYQMRNLIGKGTPFTWTPKGIVAGEGMGDGAALPRFADGGELSAGDRLPEGPGEGNLQPIARLFARIIRASWPNGVTSIGGWRPPDGYNEHSSGRALDVMLRDVGGQAGDEIKDFSIGNDKNYPINWTIWKQKMWYPPDGRSEGMPDRGSPTQNHFDHDHIFYKEKNVNPDVVPDDIVFGGFTDAAVRKGITAWAEKAFNTALGPVKASLDSGAFAPPPEIKTIPKHIYDGMVEPAKKKLLDGVSKLTSVDGWKEMLGGAVDTVKKAGGNIVGGAIDLGKRLLFDTGGVVPQGTSVVQNNTGRDEYLLNPLDTLLLRGLIAALRGVGLRPNEPAKLSPNAPTTTTPTTTTPTTTTPTTQSPAIPNTPASPNAPTTGGLPIPKQEEIKPPTQQELNDSLNDSSDGDTIPLKRNPDGTYTSTDPEWAKLIQRESGGQPGIVQQVQDVNSGGNEASGLFQIAKSTWAANGGTQYAPTAGEATPEQQAKIAAKIFNDQGGAPWGSGAGQNFGRENEDALRAGILRKSANPAPSGTPSDPINVTTTNKDWPTTANNVQPGDTTGSIYNQNLQGAAIGKDGSYKPDNNVTQGPLTVQNPNMNQGPTLAQIWDSEWGKTGQSFMKHTPLGIGGPQMDTIGKKIPAISELATSAGAMMPAYAAALAGQPQALMAKQGEALTAWATKTATDFASYVPENAGGMMESLLSGLAGPLVGTINTGASTDAVMSTMQDFQNRQMRRTKMGRGRA